MWQLPTVTCGRHTSFARPPFFRKKVILHGMSIADPWEGSTASYMQRSFEFTGKEYKIDLSALHGFGGCAKRVNARSPFMSRDDPKIGSPHILCLVKHQSVRYPGHIFQYRKPYLLFLTCEGMSYILNLSVFVRFSAHNIGGYTYFFNQNYLYIIHAG